jgi:hypothetical protein
MKRSFLFGLLLCILLSIITAADFGFHFGEVDHHEDIVEGFLPTFATVGVGYAGLDFIPEQSTELEFIFGGGYTQRRLWQDDTGVVDETSAYTYDVIQFQWNTYLKQGFGHCAISEKDLLTAYIGYEGRYESNVTAFGTAEDFETTTTVFTDLADGMAYPDLKGNHQFLSTVLAAGVTLNMMDIQPTTQFGLMADFSIRLAPRFLNSALGGEANYLGTTLDVLGAFPLYVLVAEDGLNLLSITLVDRLRLDFIVGDQVPVFVQSAASLGRKVRGFAPWTYNTTFSIVNNLDFRVSGPEPFLAGIYPQLNLFFDVGAHAGDYFNSNLSGAGIIASTGAQFTINVFDFMDFGYYVAYLFNGTNYYYEAISPGTKVVTGVTLFLEF